MRFQRVVLPAELKSYVAEFRVVLDGEHDDFINVEVSQNLIGVYLLILFDAHFIETVIADLNKKIDSAVRGD